MVSSPPVSRQRPGSACEECRRRKVRCDRGRPQCQVCYETGIECKINTARLPRGPRKGQLRTLRTRIAALERCLAEQNLSMHSQIPTLLAGTLLDGDSEEDQLREMAVVSDLGVEPFTDESAAVSQSPPASDSSLRQGGLVSELMRADLDQLYFDRVHPFAPILQRWRYHAWAKQPRKCDERLCLQHAMWTVAASLSAQFQSFRDILYQETRRMLDMLDQQSPRPDGLGLGMEQAQAWVLISLYEYMHLSPQQAWMSVGRCCRLVLGMRLYEIDDPTSPIALARDAEYVLVDWTAVEEQRRTFWMAYSLDRLISFHHGLPFTLSEQLISTRLPSPEEEFQSGQPVLAPYLPEIMAQSMSTSAGGSVATLSSFGECIVLATICGRALSHRQKVAVEQLSGTGLADGFWTRHQWLYERLSARIQALSGTTQADSMGVFARLIAQTMILFLHNVLESVAWKTGDHLLGMIEYERLCVLAAHEVVGLMKLQGQLGYFKVHPLTPIPLLMCSEFFTAHSYLDGSFELLLQEVVECLQDLDRVKNPVHVHSPLS
ncbi:fungal-specific transcription factor domain protein [Aspergillus campestris IBT 28561]|uniref:Fungal-specific transcription factor domain protein n=1 Tax=Aspergillus campestris (strain IBT 28561) TaxID=1392248 RepID=A0A2I1CS67_ASPC2|nr:fungal-specific transcription factor domain protein [Aspergillus campestris IBT 28561]PKY00458.1 fungal-specific transcription factor domain protein [Aspergillus campestris IBT 28561]